MGKGNDYRGPRRRGFDDDMFSPHDARVARSSRPIDLPTRDASAVDGPQADATVKWFNAEKGFGFVQFSDGGGDAFLHIAVLQAAGYDTVGPGTRLKVRVEQTQKGRQVTAVLELDSSGAETEQPKRVQRSLGRSWPDPSSGTDMNGTVKWFNPAKGFGFVAVDDSAKDVFVHVSVLERSGLKTLAEGEHVMMRVVQGEKGREAVSISVTS